MRTHCLFEGERLVQEISTAIKEFQHQRQDWR